MKELLTKRVIFLVVTAVALGALGGCGGSSSGAGTGSSSSDGSAGSSAGGTAPFVGPIDSSARHALKTYSVEAGTSMTTGSVPKDPFIRHYNQICREAWVGILELFPEYAGRHYDEMSESERFTAKIRDFVLPELDLRIFDIIRKIGAPRGEEHNVEEILVSMQIPIELGQKQVRLQSVSQMEELFSNYNRRARQYGLDDCTVDESHLGKIET